MSAITVCHDLREHFGPARDQAARETCLAFAVSDAHAAVLGMPWSPLCCEYLFYHAKQRDQTIASQGTTVTAIRAALELDGQPVETDWPYLLVLPTDLATWKPPAKIGALFRRRSTPIGIGFDEIWDAVEANSVVLIGMTLSGAFFRPDNEGVIDAAEPVEPDVKHALLAVATGLRGNQKLVLVRNSWGGTWGLSGYAWLSEQYLIPRIMVAIIIH